MNGFLFFSTIFSPEHIDWTVIDHFVFICEEHRVVNMLRGHLTLRWVTVRYKLCWHFASISFFSPFFILFWRFLQCTATQKRSSRGNKKAENEKNELPEIVMLHIKLDTCFIHLYHPHAAQLANMYGGNINLFIVWLLLVSGCMHIFFKRDENWWEMTVILIQP